MTDMLERAAIAIAKADNIDTKRVALANYTKHARAAILAALDPEDEALVMAVAEALGEWPPKGTMESAKLAIETLKAIAQGENAP